MARCSRCCAEDDDAAKKNKNDFFCGYYRLPPRLIKGDMETIAMALSLLRRLLREELRGGEGKPGKTEEG